MYRSGFKQYLKIKKSIIITMVINNRPSSVSNK